MSTIAERKDYLLARTATAQLIAASFVLEKKGQKKSPEERMTAAWISDELEKRGGKITDAEGAEFERIFDATDSYLAALLLMRPALLRCYAASQPGYPDLPSVYEISALLEKGK